MGKVKEGQLSEGALLKLLRTVQQEAPTHFPTLLLSLLEEAEGNQQEPEGNQTAGTEENCLTLCDWKSPLVIKNDNSNKS